MSSVPVVAGAKELTQQGLEVLNKLLTIATQPGGLGMIADWYRRMNGPDQDALNKMVAGMKPFGDGKTNG